jgi:hypothetical protein
VTPHSLIILRCTVSTPTTFSSNQPLNQHNALECGYDGGGGGGGGGGDDDDDDDDDDG